MKIDVKRQKIRKVGLEIFRRRKIGIAHQHIGIGRFGYINQLMEKFANPLSAIPAHDLRRNLVAHQVSQHGGVFSTSTDAAGDRVTDFCASARGVKKRDMLRPRDSGDDSEAIRGRLIEEPNRSRSKGAKTIDSEL